MLKPRQMSHLLIVAPKEQMDEIIHELYSHHVFHIKSYVEEKEGEFAGLSIGKPLAGAGEASSQLVKIRSIENSMGINPDEVQPAAKRSAHDVRATIDQDLARVADEVEDLLSHRTSLEGSLRDHEQQLAELEPFAAVPIPLDLYHGYETLSIFAGRIPKDVTLDVPHEKFFRGGKEGGFLAVFVPKEQESAVEQKLVESGFSPLPIPKGEGMPEDLVKAHKQAISELSEQLGQAEKRIQEIRASQAEFLVSSEELLTGDVEQAEAPLRFATTEQAFIAEGWVPINEVERLKSGLNRTTDGKIYIVDRPVEEHEESPVEYDNSAFARPSQFLTDLYSRPRYHELDPTIFIAILFPIFFGLILGDIGYGAILLIAALGLRRLFKSGDGRQLATILIYASISSIVFGVLYSEFLGFEMAWDPIIFSRHLAMGGEAAGGAGPDVVGLLMLAIWIGILQITLGRGLNAYTEFKHHGVKGLIGQGGWIAVMWGILLAIWANFALPYMPDLTTSPAVVMGINIPTIIGLVLVLLGVVGIAMESALEVIELPTIISHTLSYARLAAVGLSSVAIAMVVNYIAIGMLIQPALSEITALGIVLIIVGVLVFILGHLGNAALGLMGGALQSLRLQYVEFFTKFYRGGGIKYNPFGILKRFTED